MNNYFYDDIQEISPASLKLLDIDEAKIIIAQANCLEDAKMMALTHSAEACRWVESVVKATLELDNETN